MSEYLIDAADITKEFGAARKGEPPFAVLRNVNLKVRAGETIAIVGSSGSGKTTLLSLLAGLDTPTSGSIRIDGRDIARLSEKERSLIRAKMSGFVFQDFMLLPHMTALENVILPLEMLNQKNARERAMADLDKVGMATKSERYPGQLSGGEQQRTAIVRAFVTRPKILYADEPSGNLDDETGARVSNLLFDLNHQNNTTLILVTHDLRLANRCSVVYELRNKDLQKRPPSQKIPA